MKLLKCKESVAKIFKSNKIDANEVDIVFCEVLNIDLPKLLLTTDIDKKDWQKVKNAVKKRLSGMPVQKIFKRSYFFDMVFFVNKNVLCPRPETELVAEEAIKHLDSSKTVLDLCTGSGAIAVTIKSKTGAKVFASDISKKALYVAKKNAKKYNADIKFVCSNMFDKISQKFDLIVSNPPYIKSEDCKTLDTEVKNFDPLISLDGGKDGLNFYKVIAEKAKNHLNKNGVLVLEIGKGQSAKVCNLLAKNGFTTAVKKDYNNIDRIIVGVN